MPTTPNAYGFGLIRDLADIESKVRRALLAAMSDISIAGHMVEDGDVSRDEIKAALDRASDAIRQIIGN